MSNEKDKIQKQLNENFNFRNMMTSSETSSYKGKPIKSKPVSIPKSAFVPKKKDK